jgi:transposase
MLSKVERRHDAVIGVIRDGYTGREVATAYGVSRQSVHTRLARYESGGLLALGDRSHRPRTSPLQMAPKVEARLLELCRHHPLWGQVRLRHQLEREGVTTPLIRTRRSSRHAPRRLNPGVFTRISQLTDADGKS